jgi:hypothetical protein
MHSLADYFERNGYLRYPNPDRREKESRTYKKGYEVRLVAYSRQELTHIRRLLKAAGLPAGKPFAKVGRWVQPVYGREPVERFLQFVGA